MLNNTVNEDKQNSSARSTITKKKKFKPAGLKNTPKVVAVEIKQEDKEKIRSLKTGSHVAIPTLVTSYKLNGQDINMADFLQVVEAVSTKTYDNTEEDKEKRNAKQKVNEEKDKENEK